MDFELEIINWEKYNPRKDLRHPWWFAFSNRFFFDAQFAHFSHEELLFWIYILCEASLQNKKHVLILEAAYKRNGFNFKLAKSAISKLITCTALKVTPVPTEQNRTEQDKTEQTKQNNIIAQSFDFAQIYDLYPRKIGKAKGLAICAKTIKTKEDFDSLLVAVEKYRNQVEVDGTEPRYIKHFSSFMSSWRDWLDPDVGASNLRSEQEVRHAKMLEEFRREDENVGS